MKKKILIFSSIFFVAVFVFYSYIKNNVDFRFVFENRTNFYLRLEEKNIIDQKREDDFKSFGYCENKIKITDGIECGFYLNGYKFTIGDN